MARDEAATVKVYGVGMAPWAMPHAGRQGAGLVATLVVAAACSGPTGTPVSASAGASGAPPGGDVKTVTLAAAGDSGVSGTAMLSDAGGGQTQVAIQVEANFNRDMPGAITLGTCTAIDGSTIYDLNDTRNGTSTSLVPASLADLTAKPFIIHIHSAPDDASLAACGNIE